MQNVDDNEVDAPGENAMEYFGYQIVECQSPSARRIEIIENTFRFRRKESLGPTTHCQGIPECDQFLQDGWENQISAFVEQELRIRFTNVYEHEAIILGHNPGLSDDERGIRTAHASSAAITFVRVAKGTSQGTMGYLKLYPTSHHQTIAQFHQSPPTATQPALHPGLLLIMLGDLKWEIAPPPGCLLVIKSYSAEKMLFYCLSRYTLPFMTFTTCPKTRMDSILTTTISYTPALSAGEILRGVSSDFDNIKAFLKHDFSAIILKFRPGRDDNIRLLSLRPKHAEEHYWEAHLRQILGSKSLASGERQWLSQQGLDPEVDRPAAFAQGPIFLRSLGLENHIPSLQMGRILDRIERQVGTPGISFMWIPLFPLFRQLRQHVIEELIDLLLSTYHIVVEEGRRYAFDVTKYHGWFHEFLEYHKHQRETRS